MVWKRSGVLALTFLVFLKVLMLPVKTIWLYFAGKLFSHMQVHNLGITLN